MTFEHISLCACFSLTDITYDVVVERFLYDSYGKSRGWVRQGFADVPSVAEERVDSATTAERQFTWGTNYIDELFS